MGFSEITSVNTTLKKVSTEEDRPLAIFDDEFMASNTEFDSFSEFMADSSWSLEGEEFPITLAVGDFNDYVAQKTDFNNWAEMLNSAHDRYWERTNANRRKFNRPPCRQPAQVKQGSRQLAGEVRDVSRKGLKIRTAEALKESMFAQVNLTLAQDKMEIGGVVRWNTKRSDYDKT